MMNGSFLDLINNMTNMKKVYSKIVLSLKIMLFILNSLCLDTFAQQTITAKLEIKRIEKCINYCYELKLIITNSSDNALLINFPFSGDLIIKNNLGKNIRKDWLMKESEFFKTNITFDPIKKIYFDDTIIANIDLSEYNYQIANIEDAKKAYIELDKIVTEDYQAFLEFNKLEKLSIDDSILVMNSIKYKYQNMFFLESGQSISRVFKANALLKYPKYNKVYYNYSNLKQFKKSETILLSNEKKVVFSLKPFPKIGKYILYEGDFLSNVINLKEEREKLIKN